MLILILMCSTLVFGLKIWNLSELVKLGDVSVALLFKIEKVAEFIKVPAEFDVIIYESENLAEFHQLSNRPYHVAAVYKNGMIITQPFYILKQKGLLEEVLFHEILHSILKKNFQLPAWIEEGFILFITGADFDELRGFHRDYFLRFIRRVRYEEIPDLLDCYRIDSSMECDNGR
ncbi:hypothetical protein [Pseudothermotoga elfii]|uniref:hypothetical protein n=1 Tax=Pseudothermotoga elfii TaxID=38322 RepID=UPI0012B57920|nr:hypothetical protein [Pseudothermotoga elfii]